MNNISKIINGHDKKVTSKPCDETLKSNRRRQKLNVPLKETVKLMMQLINVTEQEIYQE